MIPYGRQSVDEDDIEAVCRALRSDWLTTGPAVEAFEAAVCAYTGAQHAVAVTNGTSALRAAMFALDVGPGDEVVVPATTFVATANAAVMCGARPVFADVHAANLCVDPQSVAEHIGPRTRALVAVDFAGHPCDYDALRALASRHGLPLVADACHALGASYKGQPVGSLANVSVLSFHPVKPITTCEGGMLLTNNPRFADRARAFRNHGVTTNFRERERMQAYAYDMEELGTNARMSDVQAALGLSQLRKLNRFIERRRAIAKLYDGAFRNHPGFEPLAASAGIEHAYHLYVLRVSRSIVGGRDAFFRELRSRNIGVNVHYRPVYQHTFYRRQPWAQREGACPQAELAYQEVVSLPIFPRMSDLDVRQVTSAVLSAADALMAAPRVASCA